MDFTGWTNSEEAKTVKSAGKVATVFWNVRGIIHIDHFPSKQMLNGDYYAALLNHFNNILKTSPFGEEESALPSSQAYMCSAPMVKFNEFRYCFPIQHIRQI